jgi:hypothetical protein
MGRGRIRILAHLQGIDLSIMFKQRKNWDRGQEVCKIKQSQEKYGQVDSYFSFDSIRGSREVVIVVSLQGNNLVPMR